MTRIYVGNLAWEATEELLRETFGADGRTVTKVDIKKNHATGKPRGFAFIDFETREEAEAAIAALNGKELAGRAIKVNDAHPEKPLIAEREERTGRGGGRPRR